MKTFLEIGSCDFDTCANWTNWQGHLYEPNPFFCGKLKEIIADKKFGGEKKIFQEGVARTTEVKKYAGHIGGYEFNDWYRGIGGFHHSSENYNFDGIAHKHQLTTLDVSCVSLDVAVTRVLTAFQALDFLKTDTEGMDLEILEGYSWSYCPTFIKCENGIDRTPDVFTENIVKLLRSKGYTTWTEERDIYAVYCR